MWLRDFHVDGLRLDAVHALADSRPHLLAQLADEVATLSAQLDRPLTLIAESDLNDPVLITPRANGGYGLDAQWDDDVHHALHALLTGERQGYYADFGSLAGLAKVLTSAFFHDGTYSTFRGRPHGKPVDRARTPGYRFVAFLQDHDQVDEAQRLSREAFDALLKVFEEPPAGVRFVLATTEPHKMPATIIGRCQRFDFHRLTMETLAAQLQAITASEGGTITDSAAFAIARQAEGSSRDALSLLDQASVMGGETVDDAVVQSLLGAPRGEVQHELADAVAVGDARTAFEIVSRLVQDGQDIRNVTAESLAHFRNLLLVKTAPGQEDLLDIQADGYEQLRVQAEKFTPGEIARVISLLLAAQNDMRWTTSPRLSLELALVRATIPETDPNPAGVVARLERLERLANLDVASSVVPAGGASDTATIPVLAPSELRSSGSPLTDTPPTVSVPGATPEPSLAEGGVARRGDPEERSREAASTGIVAPNATPTAARRASGRSEAGADAGACGGCGVGGRGDAATGVAVAHGASAVDPAGHLEGAARERHRRDVRRATGWSWRSRRRARSSSRRSRGRRRSCSRRSRICSGFARRSSAWFGRLGTRSRPRSRRCSRSSTTRIRRPTRRPCVGCRRCSARR